MGHPVNTTICLIETLFIVWFDTKLAHKSLTSIALWFHDKSVRCNNSLWSYGPWLSPERAKICSFLLYEHDSYIIYYIALDWILTTLIQIIEKLHST